MLHTQCVWSCKLFDPALIWELNAACQRVTGVPKYPTLHISNRDTGERFGLQYVEPGCRPVVLNWDKQIGRASCRERVLRLV